VSGANVVLILFTDSLIAEIKTNKRNEYTKHHLMVISIDSSPLDM